MFQNMVFACMVEYGYHNINPHNYLSCLLEIGVLYSILIMLAVLSMNEAYHQIIGSFTCKV